MYGIEWSITVLTEPLEFISGEGVDMFTFETLEEVNVSGTLGTLVGSDGRRTADNISRLLKRLMFF